MQIKGNNIFLYFILCIIFVSTSIFLMPINQVPDELNHARMSWEILHTPSSEGFNWMKEEIVSPREDQAKYFEDISKTIDTSNEKISLNISLQSLNHLPQIIGMYLASLFSGKILYIIIAGRIVNGLVYCVGSCLILKKMKIGKMLFMYITLLPIMVQQAGSLSYDVMNYLAISFYFALLSELIVEKDINRTRMYQLLLSTIFLFITKSNNLLLLMLLLFVETRYSFLPKNIEDKIIRLKVVIKRYKYWCIFFTSLLMFIFIFKISMHFGIMLPDLVKVLMNTLFNNNLNGHLNTILTIGMFGYVGNFTLQFPLWFIFLNIFSIVLFMFYNPNEINVNKSLGVASCIIFPLQVLIIITGMYFLWTPIVLGENALISVGAQGRYFTPYLIFFVPYIISLKNNINLNVNKLWMRKFLAVSILFNYLMMVLMVAITYWFNF